MAFPVTDPAAFKVLRPEFAGAKDARITAALTSAANQTDETIFGDDAEDAQVLLACHILAMGPSGREAKFRDITSDTVYSVERRRLETIHCAGYGITP